MCFEPDQSTRPIRGRTISSIFPLVSGVITRRILDLIMAASNIRESILVIGASGRTGTFVLRYLCAAAVPVIACVRRADRLPSAPWLAAAEVSIANLERPETFAALIDRAAHVVYLAGSKRNSMSPGAWQLEVESLSSCLEIAQRSGFPGRWTYVGYGGAEQQEGVPWGEARWRELKLEAEHVVRSSSVNYFIVRVGRITDVASVEPRVSVSHRSSASPDAELPCNVLAFLLTGVVMSGAAHRTTAMVQLDSKGVKLQPAVLAFRRLRPDTAQPIVSRSDSSRVSFNRE